VSVFFTFLGRDEREGTERYENIPGSITNTTPQIPISHTVRAACGPAFDGLWSRYSCCCRSKSEEGAEELCELHLENLGIGGRRNLMMV